MEKMVLLALAMVTVIPAGAAAQGTSDGRRFGIQIAGGPTIIGGGYLAGGGLIFSPASRVDLLFNVERLHLPFERDVFENGYGLTRGGDLTYVSGELRASLLPNDRLSPFVLIGVGAGISRPTVNEYFPDTVKNNMKTVYIGAGARFPVGNGVSIIGDARAQLALEGYDGIVGAWPVRAGLEWRF